MECANSRFWGFFSKNASTFFSSSAALYRSQITEEVTAKERVKSAQEKKCAK